MATMDQLADEYCQKAAEQADRDAAAKDQAIQLELEGKQALIEKDRSVAELNKAKVVEIGHGLAAGHIDRSMQQEAANQPDPQADRQRMIDESIMEARQRVAA